MKGHDVWSNWFSALWPTILGGLVFSLFGMMAAGYRDEDHSSEDVWGRLLTGVIAGAISGTLIAAVDSGFLAGAQYDASQQPFTGAMLVFGS